ncbi:somatomedin-B and thrombospondin type-1 domain-containing protein isoform X2 [Bos mutus]|uniref:somatomedin-B and thrombospondin type-1 domain-containing protein isoform X2 n=1 Tax=Bos mutus TaxID=72004 RepID=UPI0038B41E06
MGAVGRGPGSRASIAGAGGGGALPAGPRPAPDGRAARAGVGRGPARGRAWPGCSGAGALRGTPALAPKVCRARAMRTLWMALCVLARLWPGALAGCADAGRCCPGRDPACFASGWRQDRVYGTCFCDQACRLTGDCCFDYARACPVPAFITTSAFNKERTRQAASPHWTTSTEDAGYCMEFKTESLTHHCALENRPLTRWMQYLREGYTVCVDCQPPAMNSVSLRCSGDGLDSDGNQTLHWQAIGNPRCQGTWKKVRRVEQCSCPAVHSFIFI